MIATPVIDYYGVVVGHFPPECQNRSSYLDSRP
jgi:hypothetical protein